MFGVFSIRVKGTASYEVYCTKINIFIIHNSYLQKKMFDKSSEWKWICTTKYQDHHQGRLLRQSRLHGLMCMWYCQLCNNYITINDNGKQSWGKCSQIIQNWIGLKAKFNNSLSVRKNELIFDLLIFRICVHIKCESCQEVCGGGGGRIRLNKFVLRRTILQDHAFRQDSLNDVKFFLKNPQNY